MKPFSHLWQYLSEFFSEWEMFQIKVVNKIKIHILCSIIFFSENRAICVTVSKIMVEPERLQMAIWLRLACKINKATRPSPCTHTDTHIHRQKYVRLIAFPWQQWFREGALLLRYTYNACLVFLISSTQSVDTKLK